MLTDAQVILRGGSAPVSPEFEDFVVTLATGWSWDELQATPDYVRRAFFDMAMLAGVPRRG